MQAAPADAAKVLLYKLTLPERAFDNTKIGFPENLPQRRFFIARRIVRRRSGGCREINLKSATPNLKSSVYFAQLSKPMWSVCKKELRQFFSSLTGYIAIIVFLLTNGLVLFVFNNNIFDYGYATLERFFQLAPWILLLLIPAITMRSFADEFRAGTYEILQTRPLTRWQIIGGKYLGSLIVVLITLLPTAVYIFSIRQLSSEAGMDTGATAGSYLGLIFLSAVFTAIGVCASSFTNNAVVAFIFSLIGCALIYYGFSAVSFLPEFSGGADYYIEMAGIDFHYRSISRGVVDTRDIIYFLTVAGLFLAITHRNLLKR